MGTFRQPQNLNAFSQDHPQELFILNWRYMREDYCQEHTDIGRGTYILGYELYFIPGMLAEDIMAVVNADVVEDVFFYRLHHGDPWCHLCHGAGKLTWIDNARGYIERNRPGYTYDQYYREYRRNPNRIMVYSRSSFYSKDRQLYLAPTITNDGELTCRECKGTGLWLNATVHIFQGFPKIKSKIVCERS